MQSASNNTTMCPTPLTHPNVCWWKWSQFDGFILSPEGTVAKLGSVPSLETEDGEPISDESLKAIRQTLCGAWTELANQGKAPQTWGALSMSGSELFTLLMEVAHPLFKLAEDSWKLKIFTTQSPCSALDHRIWPAEVDKSPYNMGQPIVGRPMACDKIQ
ncbi:hypothetical protein PAXRUDRAFT_171848 [Paxillus rubicundulus Ve08.2h10]|uniref:Uncharacterized protein n=1 Tax=Paxillus rubicundulus Ve08.2h10 TaxID=930991 RepID=A0A0D0CX73_9AGAM|nr:hypothetical protein PAXRUDRAFT_171848 [Paxillus rubicundulus Ve08.2h10]